MGYYKIFTESIYFDESNKDTEPTYCAIVENLQELADYAKGIVNYYRHENSRYCTKKEQVKIVFNKQNMKAKQIKSGSALLYSFLFILICDENMKPIVEYRYSVQYKK